MTPYRVFIFAMLISSLVKLSPIAAAEQPRTVEMRVGNLVIDPNTNTPVVLLEAVSDKQLLPIWIDVPEARAISLEIEQVKPPRPLTHDLIRNILDGLGATVQRVTITDLRNSTYLATISLSHRGQELQIDSRPSDAIAVALRMKAPIYATARVLQASQPLPTQASRTEQTQKLLGVKTQDLTPELAKLMDSQTQHGVIVADVVAGSVAMKANIQRGDIITKLNDQPVHTAAELEASIQSLKSPSRIKLELIKMGNPTTVDIYLP